MTISKNSIRGRMRTSAFRTESRGTRSRRRKFTCPVPGCGKVFKHEGWANRHLLSMHGGERRSGRSVQKVAPLGRRKARASVGGGDWRCERVSCTAAFARKAEMVTHMRTVHLGRQEWVCREERCAKVFVKRDSLIAHQALHDTAEGRKTWRCREPSCRMAFWSKESLIRHQSGRAGWRKLEGGDVDGRVGGDAGIPRCFAPLPENDGEAGSADENGGVSMSVEDMRRVFVAVNTARGEDKTFMMEEVMFWLANEAVSEEEDVKPLTVSQINRGIREMTAMNLISPADILPSAI